MSDELVERVARAIGGLWFDGDPEAVVSNYPGQTERFREKYRQQARNAIEVIKAASVPCGVCGCAVHPELQVSITGVVPGGQKTL